MASTPPGDRACGTQNTGWLSTRHPAVGDEPMAGTVCFDADRAGFKDCFRQTEVLVCACSYDGGATTTYSYKLPAPPRCYSAYCGTDEPMEPPAPPSPPSASPLPPFPSLPPAPPPEPLAPQHPPGSPAPPSAPPGLRSCYVSVLVKPTDFDNLSEYVTRTVVREGGVETLIHGECGPLRTGATYAGNGYFECALQVPLPMSPTGTWEFESWASDAVDDNGGYGGGNLQVEYVVDCTGSCLPPASPPSPPSPPPGAPPPAPPTLYPCAAGIEVVFPSADGTDTPPHSNLGGAGPDGGAEELRYYHAGVWNDRPFDVVVTTTTPGYAPVDASATGLVAEEGGQMAQISLPADGSSPLELTFTMVDSETGDAVTVGEFYFTIFDIDGDGGAATREEVKVTGESMFALHEPTNIVVGDAGTFYSCGVADECAYPTAGDGIVQADSDEAVVCPSADGDYGACPHRADDRLDPWGLGDAQLARAVTFTFVDTSSFTVSVLSHSSEDTRLLFGGASNLVPSCKDPYPPPAPPSPPPPSPPPPSPPPSPPPPSPPPTPPPPAPPPPSPPPEPAADAAAAEPAAAAAAARALPRVAAEVARPVAAAAAAAAPAAARPVAAAAAARPGAELGPAGGRDQRDVLRDEERPRRPVRRPRRCRHRPRAARLDRRGRPLPAGGPGRHQDAGRPVRRHADRRPRDWRRRLRVR